MWLGKARLGLVERGQVRNSEIHRLAVGIMLIHSFKADEVRSGMVRFGQARSGMVRYGTVRSGQVV